MVDEMIRRVRFPSFGVGDIRRGLVLTGAAEQMFFFDAPLAHVVAYEEWRREERLRQTYRRQSRTVRRSGLELPPLPVGDGV
jgi:hypothetical protein